MASLSEAEKIGKMHGGEEADERRWPLVWFFNTAQQSDACFQELLQRFPELVGIQSFAQPDGFVIEVIDL